MNLKWNPVQYRFEVEFQNFTLEQPLVKAAAFKTDGPPQWLWYSLKAAPLTKLRENKPPVLTISPEARANYIRLKEMEDKNAEVKAQLSKHTKELKKKLQGDKQDAIKPNEYFDQELGFICLRVEPKSTPYKKFVPPPPPPDICALCKSSLYEYEFPPQGPKICFWCQKIVLDCDDVI